MANKTAILSVKIVADAAEMRKGMDKAVSNVDKFQQKMSKLTLPSTAILGGLALFGKGFLDAASDAEQAQGSVEAVFGKWSKDVDKFAANSAERLGLSGAAYDKLSAVIGVSLKSAGVPMDQLAGKVDKLNSLGADLSSVFGGTTEEAVNAMGAAFRGEYDSLERFGIVLNDSTIMAALKAKGLDKLTGSALIAAKQQEVYNQLITKGAPYLGNFAKEADTAAGAQERMTAKLTDVSAALGQQLLPYMVKFAEIASQVVTWVSQNVQLVTTLAVVIGSLAAGILVLNGVMTIMNIIAALNPFVIIAVAVAALVAIIIYLATQTTFFQDVWKTMCASAATSFRLMGNFVSGIWKNVSGFIIGAVRNIGNFFSSVFGAIGNIVGYIVGGIVNRFHAIVSVVSTVISLVQNGFYRAFAYVQGLVGGVLNFIVGAFNNVSNAIRNAISWVSSLFNGFAVPDWMRQVMNFMGMGGTGFDMAIGYNLTGLDAYSGATGGSGLGAFLSMGSNRTEVTNVNITINGAIDPVSTAKQIKQIINSDAIRNGTIAAGGSIW